MPALSVVVPAKDEAGNVGPLCAEVRAALDGAGRAAYELLIVDDGSSDGTAAEARAESERDPRVRLLRLDRNHGESAATEAGLRAARAPIVVVMDADLQQDPRDIPALLAPIERGEADCVCGFRERRGDGDSPSRVLASRLANAVRNALAGDEVGARDSGCTFRAFRRACLERVKLFRGMHRFLPTLVRLEGHRVVEVPVSHRPRRHGRSKYATWGRALEAGVDLVAVRWMRARVRPWRVQPPEG